MMQRGILIIGCLLLFGGCTRFVDYGEGYSQHRLPEEQSDRNDGKKPGANTRVTYHYVKKGDTMYSIAWQYGYDYRQLAKWNGISRPYTIYPGQKLRVRPKQKTSVNDKSVTKKSTHSTKTATSQTTRQVKSSKNSGGKIRWNWPTQGKLISRYASGDPTRQGIDIAGRKGQPIKAAASGRVVYSGSGLRGYGNLVIIKHNETYFSAYAHNNKVFVKEDEMVKSGQRIADMGNSGTEKVMLHFEIRRNGKPSNPLKYLPKKGS